MDGVIIFLDLDGVVADFFGGVCRAFGLDPEEAMRKLAPEDFWFKSLFGDLSREQFWAVIDARGAAFWADLDPYPHARCLYAALCALAPVCFLSSPSRQPHCAAGKLAWLGKHFPEALAAQDYVLTAHKHYLARAGRLLLDDSVDLCRCFCFDPEGRPTGGEAVLFAQRWNYRHREFDAGHAVTQALQEVRGRLADWPDGGYREFDDDRPVRRALRAAAWGPDQPAKDLP